MTSQSNIYASLVVVLILILLHLTGITKPLEQKAVLYLNPLQELIFQQASLPTKTLELTSQQQLSILNTELQQENIYLKEKLLAQEEFNNLNQVDLSVNLKLEVATVIQKNINTLKQFLIINKGSNHNLIVGLAVLDQSGSLIGKVSKVKDNLSIVTLLFDNFFKLGGALYQSEPTVGIISGERGLSVVMDLIPQDTIIKPGDLIVSSSSNLNIPANILIGSVEELLPTNKSLFQKVKIQPKADFNRLRLVGVVLPIVTTDQYVQD